MSRHVKQIWLTIWLLLALLIIVHGEVTAQKEAPISCASTYIVQADDSLSLIAEKLLGDRLAYPVIVSATNQKQVSDNSFAQITNVDQIEVGWKLCIPQGETAGTLLTTPTTLASAASPPPVYTLDDFVAEFTFSPAVDPAWVYESPPLVVRYPVLPAHQARFEAGYMANYVWNEHFLARYYHTMPLFRKFPAEMYYFPAPWQSLFPRYRYPPHVTLPTGLTTNQFGWRGPEITLNKPPQTIRLACVGASTTVDGHALPFSYPEYLQHWLNLWAEANNYPVQFEVINAGREAISSMDIAEVVRYELLPMEVDYVIYYEGANQFDPRRAVSYPADEVYGQPPSGIVPNFSNVESADKGVLDHLSEYSALAARLRSVFEQAVLTGQEPPKPPQVFYLPDELDEFKPQREHLGQLLDLSKILTNLDQINHDLTTHEGQLIVATFDWFVYDGLVLDPARHRNLYGYLNRKYWPISYANMRRLADFQNRVFKTWAANHDVPVIDVAGLMPRQPDLYDDAIHNSNLGVRVRAWVNFQSLLPLLQAEIEQGRLPRPDHAFLSEHPYIQPVYYTKIFSTTDTNKESPVQ